MKIPIHRHTPVRHKMSENKIYTSWYVQSGKLAPPIYDNGSLFPTQPLVTDITKKNTEPYRVDKKTHKVWWRW